MKYSLFRFLELIDIFGLAVTFRIMHSRNHKTQIGGLFTLAISVIMIYQLTTLIGYVYDQNSPSVVQQQNYVENQELYLINPKSFSFAFGVQDPLGNSFIDENVYTLRVFQQSNRRILNQVTGDYELKTQFRDIKIAPCLPQNFQIDEISAYFLKLPLSKMYCISLDEQDINIEGEFSALVFQQLNIQVFECTDKPNCADPAYRSKKLSNARFGIYTTDSLIQMTDKSKPYKPIGKNLFWNISPTLEQEVRYQIINNYVYTDVGLIQSQIVKDRVVSFSSDRESIYGRTTNRLLKFYLLYEKNKENVYYRKYMKLDQAFSQVGGAFNIFFAIGCFLCLPISQLELNRKVLNTIFDIDASEPENKSSGKKDQKNKGEHKSNQELSDSLKNPNLNCNQKSQQIINYPPKLQPQDNDNTIAENPKSPDFISYKEEIKKIFQKKGNRTQPESNYSKLKFKFSEYLLNYFSFFCKRKQSPKSQLIKFGTDIIYSHIDIFNIINKLLEVEKLKHLLLNDKQLMLFDYLPKPTLKISEILVQNREINKIPEDVRQMSFSTSFVNKSTAQMQAKDQQHIQTQLQQLNQESNFIITAQKTQQEKTSDALKAYYMITQDRKKSKVDQKLIQMLDSKFIQQFQTLQAKTNFFEGIQVSNQTSNTQLFNFNQISVKNKDIMPPLRNTNIDIQLFSLNDSVNNKTDFNTPQQNSPFPFPNNTLIKKNMLHSKKYQQQTQYTEEYEVEQLFDAPNLMIGYSSIKKPCELNNIDNI